MPAPALEMVLYPGGARTTHTVIQSGLIPDTRYRLTGAREGTFSATPLGKAALTLSLTGRTALKICRKE